jgi:hypothetical protein
MTLLEGYMGSFGDGLVMHDEQGLATYPLGTLTQRAQAAGASRKQCLALQRAFSARSLSSRAQVVCVLCSSPHPKYPVTRSPPEQSDEWHDGQPSVA